MSQHAADVRVQVLANNLWQHLEDHRQPHLPDALRIFNWQGNLLEWVQNEGRRVANEKVDTPEERAAIRDAALKVFDEWDIPKIEGFVEASVKSLLRTPLAELINGMLALSHELLKK